MMDIITAIYKLLMIVVLCVIVARMFG